LSGPIKPPKGAKKITIDPNLLKQLEALPNAHKLWAPEEDEILRRFYASKGPRALAPMFKERYGRTLHQIQKRASHIGVTRKT